jgi:MFS family permease
MFTQIRSMPRAAWVLFGGSFVNRFGNFVMPMLAIYLTRQGFSVARAGLAVGAYGAGHIFASMLGGHLADRIGRRNTTALSMFASAATMMALSQARAYGTILVLTLLAGLAAELYRPASYALIADLVPPDRHVVAFGLYRFFVNLGFAAGPATAGFLADHSFFYIFLGDAITSAIYGVIALVALPHGNRSAAREDAAGEGFLVALRDRPFVLFLAASICLTTVDFQMSSTFALHVKDLGYPTSTYGLLISTNGALIVLFELAIIHFVRRFRPQPAIATGYFLAGFGFALTGLARTIPALAGTVVVWTLGEMISSPMSGTYVAQLAPPRLRGRYMGLFALTMSIGMLIGPTLGTAAYARNPNLVWIGCGVLAVTSATLALWRGRMTA